MKNSAKANSKFLNHAIGPLQDSASTDIDIVRVVVLSLFPSSSSLQVSPFIQPKSLISRQRANYILYTLQPISNTGN